MKCHQRVIREREVKEDPRPVPDNLEGFYIKQITKAAAEPIILKYEWLGTLNRFPVAFYGLFSPEHELHGVACFGRGNGTNAGNISTHGESKAICLERGACVHWSHPHAPSMLVAGACKAMYKDHGYNTFWAYSDSQAGEIGTIYQACNWYYQGVSPGRSSNYRHKYVHKETGEEVSSRVARARKKRGKFDEGEYDRVKDLDKARYVHFEGSKTLKKQLRKGMRHPAVPYPKRLK